MKPRTPRAGLSGIERYDPYSNLRWQIACLQFKLAAERFEFLHRAEARAWQEKYDPNQPRVPAGNPDGGQWTNGGGGGRFGRNGGDAGYEIPAHIPPGANIDENIRKAESHWLNFLWFYSQVQNRGPWDYKQLGQEYADFGNFNYGASGYAAGFSVATLLRAAGWAQVRAGTSSPGWVEAVTLPQALLGIGGKPPFGDDPRDQFWISEGIKYYSINNRKR